MNDIVKATAPRVPALNDAQLAASLAQHGGIRLDVRRIVMAGQPELIATALISTPNFSWSISLLQRAIEPASTERLEAALAALSVQIAKRPTEEDDADLQLAVYAARLRQYPADVALRVLAEWPSRSKFWPTWFELEDDLNRLSRWRRDAFAAVKLAEHGEPEEPPIKRTAAVANGLRSLSQRLRAVSGAANPERKERRTASRSPNDGAPSAKRDFDAEQIEKFNNWKRDQFSRMQATDERVATGKGAAP